MEEESAAFQTVGRNPSSGPSMERLFHQTYHRHRHQPLQQAVLENLLISTSLRRD